MTTEQMIAACIKWAREHKRSGWSPEALTRMTREAVGRERG